MSEGEKSLAAQDPFAFPLYIPSAPLPQEFHFPVGSRVSHKVLGEGLVVGHKLGENNQFIEDSFEKQYFINKRFLTVVFDSQSNKLNMDFDLLQNNLKLLDNKLNLSLLTDH